MKLKSIIIFVIALTAFVFALNLIRGSSLKQKEEEEKPQKAEVHPPTIVKRIDKPAPAPPAQVQNRFDRLKLLKEEHITVLPNEVTPFKWVAYEDFNIDCRNGSNDYSQVRITFYNTLRERIKPETGREGSLTLAEWRSKNQQGHNVLGKKNPAYITLTSSNDQQAQCRINIYEKPARPYAKTIKFEIASGRTSKVHNISGHMFSTSCGDKSEDHDSVYLSYYDRGKRKVLLSRSIDIWSDDNTISLTYAHHYSSEGIRFLSQTSPPYISVTNRLSYTVSCEIRLWRYK